MKGKLKSFLIIVSIVIFTSVTSFSVGRQAEVSKKLYGSKVTSEESTQVAVVNQDLGIDYKGKNVNYALDLVKSLDSDFILTNREAGKKGIEDGKYGAMVIIPGNFSKNVTTINEVTPSKVGIYYETNDNLSQENKLIVSAKVSDLEKGLNNKLSYIYVSSVFTELHKGQDYVSEILKNDSNDFDAINSINDADILESINLTQLEKENIDISKLDFNRNFKENKEVIENIDKRYRKRLLDKEEKFEEIKNELLNVTGNSATGIKSFESEIGKMTPTELRVALAKKHKYNYDISSINYDVNIDDVNKYIEDLTKKDGEIDSVVSTYKKDVLAEIDEKGKSAIKQSNENLNKVKESTDFNMDIIKNNSIGGLKTLRSNIKNGNGNDSKIQSLNEEYLLYGEMVKELRKSNPGIFENIYKNVVDGNKVNYSKILKDPTMGLSYSNTFTDWNDLKTYITDVPDVLARSSKYKGTDVNNSESSADVTLIDSIIYDLNGVQDKLKETSTSTVNIMKDSDYKYINNLFTEGTDVSLEDKFKLKESLIEEIKENLDGKKKKSLITNIRNNNLDNVKDVQQKVETEVQTVLANDEPMDVNVNSLLKLFNEKYMSRFNNVIKQVDDLGKTAPTVDDDNQIKRLWSRYDKSIDELNVTVTKQIDDYDKAVEKVKDDADKQVTIMQEDLDKAIQASQGKLASSLKNAKATKVNTTNDNQEKLGSLSTVLSNTRVGTVENTDIYNFMIKPVSAMQTKDMAANIVKPQQDNNYKVKVIILSLSSMCVFILAITGIRYKRKTKMKI